MGPDLQEQNHGARITGPESQGQNHRARITGTESCDGSGGQYSFDWAPVAYIALRGRKRLLGAS